MSSTLREITESNSLECIRLRVRDDQRFVASNVYSVAQSKIEPKYVPMAIYHEDTMVGFVMYELNYQKKELYVCRLMIDQQYQHMGYGKGALDVLKEIAVGDPGIEKIELSTKPDNTYGITVYERFGFKDTGLLDEGEEVFVLNVRTPEGE